MEATIEVGTQEELESLILSFKNLEPETKAKLKIHQAVWFKVEKDKFEKDKCDSEIGDSTKTMNEQFYNKKFDKENYYVPITRNGTGHYKAVSVSEFEKWLEKFPGSAVLEPTVSEVEEEIISIEKVAEVKEVK